MRVALALALVLALAACPRRAEKKATPVDAQAASTRRQIPANPFTVNWDPKSGKGDVVQRLESGDLLRTCFHVGYAGYTGGLVIGSLDGSGLGFYPKRPLRGFRRINVFCAQDESIWDRDERVEYSYGWSENFGKGDDGKRLDYRRGRALQTGPGRVVLQSENAGGCYRVTKVATARAGTRYWIIATRITNRCDRPVRFDFFSGDDPWVGRYRSSEGDVGWTPAGIVREERALGRGEFTAGGFVDRGNRALGQVEGSFSGQANFIALDPAVELPDLALFANRFAHRPAEIEKGRALDNESLTALNLGWTGRRLAPGQGWTVAFALGLADTDTRRPEALPGLPAIGPADWSSWRPHLREGTGRRSGDAVTFAAERVVCELRPRWLEVEGTYWLRGQGTGATVGIDYPIITAADRPAPAKVLVDGRAVGVAASAPAVARFSVSVPDRGLARFVVRYRQQHHGRRAAYMVTSARRWGTALTRAVFVIRHPRSMGTVSLSYAPDHSRTIDGGKTVEQIIVRQPFWPDRELEMRWGPQQK